MQTQTLTKNSWQYQREGKRDLRLDWLRGFALFAMSINHAGLASYLQYITGNSEFLINAAEGFFFISGFTLGFISIGRDAKTAVNRVLKRTWIIYLATLGIAFGFAAAAMLTNLPLWGEFEVETYGGLVQWAISTVTMFDAFHGSDILIAYVVYLSIAPLAISGLLKNHTKRVLGAAILVYVLSQISIDLTSLPFASFRHLAANNLIFFGGMVLGFHWNTLSAFWKSWKWSRLVDTVVVVLSILLLDWVCNRF